jgi:membrane fusion protein (multidrug efflux system)
MTTKSALASGVIPAILLSSILLGGCGGASDQGTQASEEMYPVETTNVVYSEFSPTLSYKATVLPGRKALLGAELTGRVQKLHVDTGDGVEAGQLLVELASGQLAQAESQYRAAEKDWQRMKALLHQGAVTQQAFDHAEAAYISAKASYETILESARIRAPFAGVISGRYLDEGELFTMAPSGTGAPAILEISNTDSVKIQIEVSEKERKSARKGLAATISVDDFPGKTYRGVVDRIDPGLDLKSRTSTADIVISNPGHELRPGMFADVQLELVPREGLLIPRDALVRQEGTGTFFAYVVTDGVAHRRDLTLGDGLGANIEILKGLSSGEQVVTAGRYKLHDGVKVLEGGAIPDTTGTSGTGAGKSGQEASR